LNEKFIGVFYIEGKIYYKKGKKIQFIMNSSEIKLLGEKNLENVLAAISISIISKVDLVTIRNSVASFIPLHNRLETIALQEGILYVNDSKATNIASTLGDVKAFKDPIILMLGGSDKGEDFKILFSSLDENIYKSIIYGSTRENMKKCADEVGYSKYIMCEDFEEAFIEANRIAKDLSKQEGNCVLLLSPACASFDEFKNYEQRGERFKELVNLEIKG
jgi:UDP-N-acetylmuramoylalanine--D-glutamate ligase